ncbi:MAG: PAS domain-containing protein, partial [Pirellulales bacterium]
AESIEMVFPLRGQDGAIHPLLTRIHPVKDSQGQVVRRIGTNTDISEVQRREEELQKIRSRLESTLAAAEIGTWEYDPINNVVQGDRNLAAMFGFSPRVAVAGSLEDYLEAIQPEDRQRVAEVIAQALRVGNTFETNYRLRGKNGETRSVIARGRVERDAGGRAIRMPGVAMDVTGQRRAEAELRESEARWRLALESAELGSWHIDPATNELSTDERFRLIVHGSTSPIDYEQAFAALHDDDRQRIRESIAAAIDPDRLAPYAEEYRVVHPDGSVRWILAKGRANFEQTEENPRVASFDGTVMDITARKLADEALRALAARLSEADRRKDVFLATLAHELRNPLAPIRTGLEVMKLAKDDPVMMEEVRGTMERQAQQMVRLIDDLLEVSRITQGKLELRKCQVSLAEVVRNAVEASQPFVQESNHQLRVTLPPAPILLDADPHRLAQVLANLLNNAAKYTPAGGHIELIAQPQGNEVMVTVKDNGIGIPPELQGGIFEMFSQIDRSLETGYKGLGIGLTLVKRLVEMHGGKVEVHSGGKNQGSEFAVSLPVLPPSVAEPERPPVAENAKPAKLRVLVVDDNADAATTLGMVVKMLGNEVRTAGDGLQGVELAQQFQPHVVLMDIGMPRMNGYEASKAIRQQPWGQAMMLVALTGWGQDDDRQKALDAGFNHHLVKPAEPSELQRIFAQLR